MTLGVGPIIPWKPQASALPRLRLDGNLDLSTDHLTFKLDRSHVHAQ